MKREAIYVRIPEELKKQFLYICVATDKNQDQIITELLTQFVKENKEIIQW